MEKKDIKFFVKRIFTKDLSLESPEAPAIFDNIKSTPKIAFNLNTTIATIDDTTYDITLDINVKAETENNVIYVVEVKQSGLFVIDGVDDELKDVFLNIRCPEVIFPYARETISSLVQKAGFPPIFIAPIDFNALYQQEQSKNKH
ncbi:MAG: protein-export chaperone SecB [Gammaproteobacteria bacterium]|jgi:preprotein translocase subunit SecB|nr:protein-export chaperone SecB [Gammaproteobacteria bacterium]MBT4462355.1 protein-export chaperone SecB [Gammaproteobacteria bacterium]MBT4655282.1 protein-export chaperone SecB [Gammaproteobacteria bacterium]MBT5117208.1 protein-export chaperone SecB [Gammaproteobacteria bacterium]MBT5762097.1 protein-export chaperone SecB [Gammaproteobacteria bacterium]